MKRTVSKLLSIAALAIGMIGGLTAASPAQAAYVAPFVPMGCSIVVTSSEYPYRASGTPTTTGWYVYCGADPTTFKMRAGDLLQTLPNSSPQPEWRQKFQNANYTLYVFSTAAQAKSLMGAAAFPAASQANGVQGLHQPTAIGNATTGFVSIFESYKDNSGSLVTYSGSALYDFDEVLYHETGHAMDTLLAAAGSSSTTTNSFRPRVQKDITNFNARNGCATTGPDSNLWGAKKTIICNTSGGKKPPYDTKTNLQIVQSFNVTSPTWTQYFQSPASYRELWAQMMAINRGGAGNSWSEIDGWINIIYPCGKAYTNQLYTLYTTPITTCP